MSLFSLAVAAPLLYLSASRGPLIALALCVGLYTLNLRLWPLLLLMVGIAFFVVDAAPIVDGESLFDRVRITGESGEYSTTSRLDLIGVAWSEFLDHPIFGSGYSLPLFGGYPHNIIVESGMALGLVGFLLMIALVGRSLLRSAVEMNGPHAFSAVLFVQYFVSSQFSGSLWGDPALYLFIGRLLVSSNSSKQG
jgi:O-antigen ligase